MKLKSFNAFSIHLCCHVPLAADLVDVLLWCRHALVDFSSIPRCAAATVFWKQRAGLPVHLQHLALVGLQDGCAVYRCIGVAELGASVRDHDVFCCLHSPAVFLYHLLSASILLILLILIEYLDPEVQVRIQIEVASRLNAIQTLLLLDFKPLLAGQPIHIVIVVIRNRQSDHMLIQLLLPHHLLRRSRVMNMQVLFWGLLL